jgi:hypothetical protein
MSRFRSVFFIGLISLMLWSNSSFSQVTLSPYSAIGIGDILDPTTASKFGMAGLGVSNGTYFSLNIVNPALLHYNRVALFSAAVLAETKTISQEGFEPYAVGSGQLNHMALAFPLISGKLSTSLVLNPYSAVNYNVSFQVPIEGHPTDSAFISAKGDGGIDQLSLSFGGEILSGLSVGLRASYLFSSIRKEGKSFVPLTTANNYVATINERVSFQDFMFGLGVAYKYKIGETSSLNVGATYDFKTEVDSKLFTRFDQELITGGTVFGDTIEDNTPIKVTLPTKMAVGFSYNYKNKMLLGVDYTVQDWSESKDFGTDQTIYSKREKYVFGAEITPDINSINNYFKRMTYRFGASYTNTPYILGDTQISDFGINFGMSLPVVRFSSLDFGVQLGSRGTLTNNLIQENYFKVYFGVSFNDSRWFLQPKFN